MGNSNSSSQHERFTIFKKKSTPKNSPSKTINYTVAPDRRSSIGQYSNNSNNLDDIITEENNEVKDYPHIILLPHQHTLFCERKQRVCLSVGKCQELERLRFEKCEGIESWKWFRYKESQLSSSSNKNSLEFIKGSNNQFEYCLQLEDVDHFIGIVYSLKDENLLETNKDDEEVNEEVNEVKIVEENLENNIDVDLDSKLIENNEEKTQENIPKVSEELDNKFEIKIEDEINNTIIEIEIKQDGNDDVGFLHHQNLYKKTNLYGPILSGPPRLPLLKVSGTILLNQNNDEVNINERNKMNKKNNNKHNRSIEIIQSDKYKLEDTNDENNNKKENEEDIEEEEDMSKYKLKLKSYAIAQYIYMGGYPGECEFWWMKITPDGKRINLTEPIKAPALGKDLDYSHNCIEDYDINDPRLYLIKEDDAGCRLKVKCRPVRSDGFSGEIFTSASSLKIEGGNPSDDESDSD